MTDTTSTNTTPRTYYVDAGPVLDAIQILVAASTLADHVTISSQGHVSEVEWTDSIPVDLTGSGTSGLWALVGAIGTRRHTVSLYDVVDHLDPRNRFAVASAVAALCGAR